MKAIATIFSQHVLTKFGENPKKQCFFNENLEIFFHKGESNFEKIVNIITYMRPNHLKVNVINISDRFEHVVNPKCTRAVLENYLQTKF